VADAVSVDGVADLPDEPAVVSVSDVHGHRDRFESVLLTPADHPEFEPLVERRGDGDASGDVGGGLR
jgi:hypothetical protein